MKTCPRCKTTGLPDEAEFCPHCGEKIAPKAKPSSQRKDSYGNKKTPKKQEETSFMSFIGIMFFSAIIPGFNIIMLFKVALDKESNKVEAIAVILGIIIDIILFTLPNL